MGNQLKDGAMLGIVAAFATLLVYKYGGVTV